MLHFAMAAALAAGSTAPVLDQYIPSAEASLRATMLDPASATFSWPYELAVDKKGVYWTCGRFNAKNAFGGYGGEEWILLRIKDGKVITLQSEYSGRPFVEYQCNDGLRKRVLTRR